MPTTPWTGERQAITTTATITTRHSPTPHHHPSPPAPRHPTPPLNARATAHHPPVTCHRHPCTTMTGPRIIAKNIPKSPKFWSPITGTHQGRDGFTGSC
ncbi:hypothetical protein E2C01_086709 [Portunus trituberculatus]|uniref:Uncharacterized protein n=1 Tax=Portunus trituberculatus TaxID=210409 RepID=A0A5B7JE73_PORTR|nr:hypothetical protein [Portunus trituberculatus]